MIRLGAKILILKPAGHNTITRELNDRFKKYPAQKHVIVIIVNFNTADLTVNCLKSLLNQDNDTCRLSAIVVDNSSKDNSVSELFSQIKKNNWADWVKLLPLEQNGGFAYGNNQAIYTINELDLKPDYIWLLNPDTIALENSFIEMFNFMEVHPRLALLAVASNILMGV